MPARLLSIASALGLIGFVASTCVGCTTGMDDSPAAAAPTTTGIPMGAPGAKGASFDPPPATATPPGPRIDGLEEKIAPGPEPAVPPTPFGTTPDDDDSEPTPPPVKIKKPPKGTNL